MARSSTRLLVLGVVLLLQPVHGYDVRRELLSWGADQWANVSPGSIYNALKTLENDRLIEVSGSDREGRRPERTTYRVTETGDGEFTKLLLENLWRSEMPNHPILVGTAFLPGLSREELESALRGRISKLEADVAFCEEGIRQVLEKPDPTYGTVLFHVAESKRLTKMLLQAELEWTHGLLERVSSGELDKMWSGYLPRDK
ncbi:PadR family transcriptional regulator [Spiractinospora alimapuensis]|uniref:PadR family transcriptional regulator n=1 Tax=Spiractinospora alimapuensis TaxID=2820884 RepID=UPI001F216353|nr:PadR family transcriptional regulator [Spiractinospora alimapuensis]QVQ50134.1 PadR family transcriptional regulator [Spiractinospora alimapuensis]